ncbi:hypothetical protein CRE_30712 [Caenorhabditis remanei]|uniref:G-protein coupled receptors family 1 profile domain-containing protein n=1 Tax=Caenorhabditis remanei TaxID=31234 RepID=E3LTV8_CAERE|nr:hypothetical protein CRE_30712 [Caenorhabditis remanei]
MIWQGPVFAIFMHVFAYIYNAILFYMLERKKVVHSRIYMYNMIISELFMNLSQNILVEYPYFVTQDPKFYSFPLVKCVEMFSQLGYQSKFFLAILMAVNRLWVVLIPIGSEVFSSYRLKIYMMIGWIALFCRQLIILIPDDCYFKMDLVQFQVMSVCEDVEKHKLRMRIVSPLKLK